MARYIDADSVMRLIPMEESVARMAIANAPIADEEKIATEYCMKRCLVMMTMDTYEKLIACYNRCAGLRDERRTENIPRVIGTSPTEHLVRCKERREDAET